MCRQGEADWNHSGKENAIEPAYLEPEGKAEFFIRAGTTTQLLNPKEAIAYFKLHWHS